MRRSLFVVLSLLFVLNASAQEFKNTISVSYGSLTHRNFKGTLPEDLLGDDNEKGEFSGAISIEYARAINKTFRVGAIVNYEHEQETVMKLTGHHIALMPCARAYWFNKTQNKINFAMYSKIGVGVGYYSQSYSKRNKDYNESGVNAAVQVSAVSFEVGNKRIRGFAEIGYGMQGMLNLGVLYNF